MSWVYRYFLRLFACLWITSSAYASPKIELEGRVEVIFIHHKKRGKSEEPLYLFFEKSSKKPWTLKWVNPQKNELLKLQTGDNIAVLGTPGDSQVLDVYSWYFLRSKVKSVEVFTERRAVFVMVDFSDLKASSSFTRQQLSQVIYSNQDSVANYFEKVSQGKVKFTSYPDAQNILPPVALDFPAICDGYTVADAVENKLKEASFDLNAYQHRVYLLPPALAYRCGLAGMATVGCGDFCRAWLFFADKPYNYAHELGHHLGMNHASTVDNEYGDNSDPMGNSWQMTSYNAPHMNQLNLLEDAMIPTIKTTGIYQIVSLSNPDLKKPMVLKIAKPDTNENYYVSWRSNDGIDASLDRLYTNNLSIHRFAEEKIGRSFLLSQLKEGALWSDAQNAIYIANTKIDHKEKTATVAVQFGTPSCDNKIASMLAPLKVRLKTTAQIIATVKNLDSPVCKVPLNLKLKAPAGVFVTYLDPLPTSLFGQQSIGIRISLTRSKKARRGNYSLRFTQNDQVSAVAALSLP